MPRGDLAVVAAHVHADRHQVPPLGLRELGGHGRNEQVTRHDLLPLYLHRRDVEEAELPDRAHDRDVSRVTERLVLHRADLPLVRPRQVEMPPPVWNASRTPTGGG